MLLMFSVIGEKIYVSCSKCWSSCWYQLWIYLQWRQLITIAKLW